jgi:hypothetical protein
MSRYISLDYSLAINCPYRKYDRSCVVFSYEVGSSVRLSSFVNQVVSPHALTSPTDKVYSNNNI